MNISELAKQVGKTLRSNSPMILTGAGVTGVLSTAYLTAKGAFKAADIILGRDIEGFGDDWKMKAKVTWKCYIPATASGVLTIGCIIGGAKIGTKRAAAAYSLLTVSEHAFSEYKEKVVEQLGEKKEQAIRDEIAQDRMKGSGDQANVVIVESGKVLCYEMHTGRYFNCDMETLRRAQNDINSQMHKENEANLNDFYHLVGLPHTSDSSRVGWDVDKKLELRYSTVLSEDNRPCIAFEYNYIKML